MPGESVAAGLPDWAIVGPARRAHVERVAGLVARWAAALAVADDERDRWLRAAWLHDALRDAPDVELARWAPDDTGPAELLHGPAAAARAAAAGETDRQVLEAVRYHSVGHPAWAMTGRTLYCADFLEPGRRSDGAERARLAARYPDDPGGVLLEVARRRVRHAVDCGWTIPELTWRFWNALAGGSASRR